jgi:hypothetical protein
MALNVRRIVEDSPRQIAGTGSRLSLIPGMMWTDELDPRILRKPQIRIPAQQPRAFLAFDWGPLESADLDSIQSTRDPKVVKRLAGRLIRAPALPLDDGTRAQRVFRVAQVIIRSLLSQAARDERLLRRQTEEVHAVCPYCRILFQSAEYRDAHVVRRHLQAATGPRADLVTLPRHDEVGWRVDEWQSRRAPMRRDPLMMSNSLVVNFNQKPFLIQSHAVSLGSGPRAGQLFQSDPFYVEADHAKELLMFGPEFCVEIDRIGSLLRLSQPFSPEFDPPLEPDCMEFNPQMLRPSGSIGISGSIDSAASWPRLPVATISLPIDSRASNDSPGRICRNPRSSILLRSPMTSPASSEESGNGSLSSPRTVIITPAEGIPSDFCSGGSFSSTDGTVCQAELRSPDPKHLSDIDAIGSDGSIGIAERSDFSRKSTRTTAPM